MIVTARGLLAASFVSLLAACATPPAPSAQPAARAAAVRPVTPTAPRPEKTSDRASAAAETAAAPERSADGTATSEPSAATPSGPTASSATDPADGTNNTGFGKGLASWYGRKFHGRRTASGERYDRHAFTAAHRTLPFGTRVRVHSEATGKDVVVRVNDRGPYKHARIIDLSEAAIAALGLKNRGVTAVELLPE